MADDLELLVGKAEGEGPSPEFVALLRARIVEEATPAAGGLHEVDVIALDLEQEPSRSPSVIQRLATVAAALAVFALAGTVIVTMVANRPPDSGDSPTFDAEATLLPAPSSPLPADTYLVDSVGSPFTVSTGEPLVVAIDSRGHLTLAHPAAQGIDDRTLAFTRLSALSDPVASGGSSTDPTAGWPTDDLDGWLDAMSGAILVAGRQQTMLGGLPATRLDVTVGGTGCQQGDGSCPRFGTNHSVHDIELRPKVTYRIWLVEQGAEDPLAVVASIDRLADSGWFDTVDQILSTVAFGPPGPNPVIVATPGPTDLPFLGGIRVDLPAESFAFHDPAGPGRVSLGDWWAETGFVANPVGLHGSPLDTADDLATALRAAGVDLVEIETTTVDGIGARVFEITGGPAEPALRVRADSRRAWTAPAGGRLWAVEHPDRGLLLITAEALENLDIVNPLIVAQTEAIIDSLRFVELD